MEPDVVFRTARLFARPFRLDDAADMFAVWSDPEVVRYLVGMTPTASVEQQREYLGPIIAKYEALGGRYGGWALVEQASGRAVGCGLLKPIPGLDMEPTAEIEIGWHLRRDLWGQGLASEAARALVDIGFRTLDVPRLIAVIEPGNARSMAVARRLGMHDAGPTRAYYGGRGLGLWTLARPT